MRDKGTQRIPFAGNFGGSRGGGQAEVIISCPQCVPASSLYNQTSKYNYSGSKFLVTNAWKTHPHAQRNKHPMSNNFSEVASAAVVSSNQRLFLRYFTAILIDLVVLNVFAEYWQHVTIHSFTISLCAAALLQVLLKLTLAIEQRVANYFNSKEGTLARTMRFISAWAILFFSKFIILGAIKFSFGDSIIFSGPLHGIVAFIAVIVVMLVAEEAIVRFYNRLS